MKTSVYVPDDLWERVKALEPELGVSQVVQEALRARVEAATPKPTYKELPAKLQEGLQAAQEKAREKLGELYQLGFATGLRIAEDMSGLEFAYAASFGFDIDELWDTVLGEWLLADEWANNLPSNVRDWSEVADEQPTGVLAEGLRDALVAVWPGNTATAEAEPPRPAAPAALAVVNGDRPPEEGGVVADSEPFPEEGSGDA